MYQNGQMAIFAETLGQIISGTKCDKDKLIFSAERGSQ